MKREYSLKDYPLVCSWWVGHDWHPIHPSLLPKFGLIVDNVCAGFLYKTDSGMGILEFIVADPKSDKEERSKALDELIEGLLDEAKKSGIKSIFSSVVHPKLIDRYKSHGFVVTDKNVTNLIRSI